MSASPSLYKVESAAAYTLVTISPQLGNQTWNDMQEVQQQVTEALTESKTDRLIVDVSDMEYINSAMQALIVRLWGPVKQNGGKLALINNNPVAVDGLKISGFDKLWAIVDNRAQALTALDIDADSADEESTPGD